MRFLTSCGYPVGLDSRFATLGMFWFGRGQADDSSMQGAWVDESRGPREKTTR